MSLFMVSAPQLRLRVGPHGAMGVCAEELAQDGAGGTVTAGYETELESGLSLLASDSINLPPREPRHPFQTRKLLELPGGAGPQDDGGLTCGDF